MSHITYHIPFLVIASDEVARQSSIEVLVFVMVLVLGFRVESVEWKV